MTSLLPRIALPASFCLFLCARFFSVSFTNFTDSPLHHPTAYNIITSAVSPSIKASSTRVPGRKKLEREEEEELVENMVGSSSYGGSSFLRQLSGKEGLHSSSSKRWRNKKGGPKRSLQHMEGVDMSENGVEMRKRVIVVVDSSTSAKHAMMWALTHAANKGDLLTLLEVTSPHRSQRKSIFTETSPQLARSLGTLCKACRPEVDVETLVIQGPKLDTVLSQVKKLEASVLVLGQKKPSPLNCLIKSSNEEFVEQCISNADCLTMAVRKPSGGLGGYLISTRWQKNFWLLA